jgi:hypothetical protein
MNSIVAFLLGLWFGSFVSLFWFILLSKEDPHDKQ